MVSGTDGAAMQSNKQTNLPHYDSAAGVAKTKRFFISLTCCFQSHALLIEAFHLQSKETAGRNGEWN